MSNLVQYVRGNLEIVIDHSTGACYASHSGLARLVDSNESDISAWATAQSLPTISAEILTGAGMRSAHLLKENAIKMAFVKFNPEMVVFSMHAGVRGFLHFQFGYLHTDPTATKKTFSAVEYIQAAKDIPHLAVPDSIKERLLDMLSEELRNH